MESISIMPTTPVLTPPLYGDFSPFVNSEGHVQPGNSDPDIPAMNVDHQTASPASEPLPPLPPLATLFDRELLATLAAGHLNLQFGMPKLRARCVAERIRHMSDTSDRSWQCQKTVAEAVGCDPRTVLRTDADMDVYLGIFAPTGEELLNSDGPHNFTGKKRTEKLARRETKTRDFTSLRKIIPQWLVDLYLWHRNRARRREEAEAASAAARVKSTRPAPTPQEIAEFDAIGDPFGEEQQEQVSLPSALSVSVMTSSPTLGLAPGPAQCSNVIIEKTAGEFQKKPSEDRPKRSNLSDKKVTSPTPKTARPLGETDLAAVNALRDLGIYQSLAEGIVDRRGSLFARKLIAYATWRATGHDGAYVLKTEARFDSWPDEFEVVWERDHHSRRRAYQAPADHQMQKVGALMPQKPSEGRAGTPEDVFKPDLPEDVPLEWMKKAFAELMAALANEPGLQKLIDRLGLNHPNVEKRARTLMLMEQAHARGST